MAGGPSIGGLRMAPDVSTEECFRLARTMTLNNATTDLPHGGGKSVIEGANIPITQGAEKYLHEKGVLCVPDFIANAGGVICAAMEYQGACQSVAFQTIEDKLHRNTRLVLEDAATKGILPREAAVDLAVQRLKKSMSYIIDAGRCSRQLPGSYS